MVGLNRVTATPQHPGLTLILDTCWTQQLHTVDLLCAAQIYSTVSCTATSAAHQKSHWDVSKLQVSVSVRQNQRARASNHFTERKCFVNVTDISVPPLSAGTRLSQWNRKYTALFDGRFFCYTVEAPSTEELLNKPVCVSCTETCVCGRQPTAWSVQKHRTLLTWLSL